MGIIRLMRVLGRGDKECSEAMNDILAQVSYRVVGWGGLVWGCGPGVEVWPWCGGVAWCGGCSLGMEGVALVWRVYNGIGQQLYGVPVSVIQGSYRVLKRH